MTIYADRVQETTTTTGTGTATLGGAVSGFRTFASAFTNGDTVRYTIWLGTEWEVGEGVYSSGTLTRVTVFASSNAGALVSFSAGSKFVWCDFPAASITETINAAKAAAVYELSFQTGLLVTVTTNFSRVGARVIDVSKYPTITGYTRHFRFLADVEKTAGATSGTVQLYDVTHNVLVTNTNLTTTSTANEEKDSGDLTVGSSSGNVRSDVASNYELQLKVTGGTTGVDAASVTNARLFVYYT